MGDNRIATVVALIKRTVCFRECAKIIKIANENDCKITIYKGSKSGDSDSLLSIAKLELNSGQTAIIRAEGKNPEAACGQCMKFFGHDDEK